MVPLCLLQASEIPYDIRKSAVDSLYKKRRAEEEIGILRMELPRVIEYMLDQRQVLLKELQDVTNYQNIASTQKGMDQGTLLFIEGSCARLQYELYLLDGILRYFHQSFQVMITSGHIPNVTLPNLPTELESGVEDYRHIFTQEERNVLEAEIERFEKETEGDIGEV